MPFNVTTIPYNFFSFCVIPYIALFYWYEFLQIDPNHVHKWAFVCVTTIFIKLGPKNLHNQMGLCLCCYNFIKMGPNHPHNQTPMMLVLL